MHKRQRQSYRMYHVSFDHDSRGFYFFSLQMENCLWREVLSELPWDVFHYLCFHFRVPFVIAKREMEWILPLYETIEKIPSEVGLILFPDCVKDCGFDYQAAERLFLNTDLVLDRRIDPGRILLYESVIQKLIRPFDPLDCITILNRGLKWESFSCFIRACDIGHDGGKFSNMYSYLDKLVRRLNVDPDFREYVKTWFTNFYNRFILVSLLHEHEVALRQFLNDAANIGHEKVYLGLRHPLKGNVLSLYEKYKDFFI